MGRGLSDLQKAILKLSWDEIQEHQKARGALDKDPVLMAEWLEYYVHGRGAPVPEKFAVLVKDNWTGLIDTNDIFISFYGWTPKTNRFGRKYIPKSEIGQKKYMAAYIAVRKSLNRLIARELMGVSRGRYNGYALTIEGLDLMAKLGE